MVDALTSKDDEGRRSLR